MKPKTQTSTVSEFSPRYKKMETYRIIDRPLFFVKEIQQIPVLTRTGEVIYMDKPVFQLEFARGVLRVTAAEEEKGKG